MSLDTPVDAGLETGSWAVAARPGLFVFAQPGVTTDVATQVRHGDAVRVGQTVEVDGVAWCAVSGGALGEEASGDRGWVEASALVSAGRAFGGGVDVTRRNDEAPGGSGGGGWLRVSSLLGQGFAAASRKQGPAAVELPAEAWVRGLDETHGDAAGGPGGDAGASVLVDNAWHHVALADGRAAWVQGGDLCAGALPALKDGGALVREATRMLGRPYVWGGSSTRGMDCSGLTAMLARRSWRNTGRGLFLPHSAKRQFEQTWEGFERVGDDRTVEQVGEGTRGEEREPGTVAFQLAEEAEQRWGGLLRPGDIVFFAMGGERVDHVGVYAGGDEAARAASGLPGAEALMIHASSSGRPCVKRQGLWHECGADAGSGTLEREAGAEDAARTAWAMRMVGVRRLTATSGNA